MITEVISVGTEYVVGSVANDTSAYVVRICNESCYQLNYLTTTIEKKDAITSALVTSLQRAELIFVHASNQEALSICRNAVREVIANDMIESHTRLSEEEELYGEMINTKKQQIVIIIPGDHYQSIRMFDQFVLPKLEHLTSASLTRKVIKMLGITKEEVTKVCDELELPEHVTVSVVEVQYEVHVYVSTTTERLVDAKKVLKPIVKEIKSKWKDYIYSTDESETIEEVVVKLLKKYELTVTTAESCTGGMCASRLINVSGASDVIKEAFVTYSNKAKRKYLDVNKETLKKYSAVSEKTAKEMAKGAAIVTGCDCALSLTGYAGPEGGDELNPVGTVYIGCYYNGKAKVERIVCSGSRLEVREQATLYALNLLRRCIKESDL